MLNALLWNLLLTAGLAVVLAALCRLPSLRRQPAIRHWLWLLLLVKLITPPLIAVPLLPVVADTNETAVMTTPPERPTGYHESAFDQRTQTNPGADDRNSALMARDTGEIAPQEPESHTQTLFLGGLLAISLTGTCVLLTVHGVHAVKLIRWLRRAATKNPLLAQTCTEVASGMKIRGLVRSCVVDARTTPLLCGWRRPVVVVPRQLMDELSPQQLRGILAHELAHLARRDHWANLFVFAVKTLMWWNPVVWWADRELRAAQELCCDAMAIDRCSANRRGYASTLLKALEFIQTEPMAPHALVLGMGSRKSILRRFEMIGETKLSYQLSRWSFLALWVLAVPLVCIPVHGQEEKQKSAVPATQAASDAVGKKEESAKAEPAKTSDVADTKTIDPKIKALGESVYKRITTWSDEDTLILDDGQTGRMKVKKNVTPVAEILVTPHFGELGTKFELEGVDGSGKVIEGTKANSSVIHDAAGENLGLGKTFSVGGESIFCKIHLNPKGQDDGRVAVKVKVLLARLPTTEEINAMLRTQGKDGQMHLDLQKISRWIMEQREKTGQYPKDLKGFDGPLPKDVYSPTGDDYHYEAQRSRFILSSCGKDGIYGDDDDEIMVCRGTGQLIETGTGTRGSMYPLEDEKEDKKSSETILHGRPQGNCSISGIVLSEATDKPIGHARIYLHYNVTHSSIFLNTTADGAFTIPNIPKGPYSLQASHTPGYQDVAYNPDDRPLPYPQFSLKDGEHRSGIVLKAKPAYQISGKILDEDGNAPKDVNTLRVLAWCWNDQSKQYTLEQTGARPDGSYFIDGLDNRPAYVMVIDWRAARRGEAYPPIYYPGTFSRSDAKPITFDQQRHVKNIDITLKKDGGSTIEGTVLDEAGKPVPEAFVVVHHRDMLFDFNTAYTNAQGRYQIQGVGDGKFLVHVDAVHRGFVRTRTPVQIQKTDTTTQLDFTLKHGVTISGKFVDEKGNDWTIGESGGYACLVKPNGKKTTETVSSFSLTDFRNKHRPKDSQESSGGDFTAGKGDYESDQMLFPTPNTFLIQGLMPGHVEISFRPQKERQKVVKILYDGRDIQKSGIDTKPGQEIKDVTIVIGKE